MNLKKKMKGFFTLTRKADGGFTLVELIVVIAILAILAGVAVPAYSGYVTQANKQADMTLASEVAHAMMLNYYNDPTNAASGYVILKNDGTDAEADEVGIAAMEKSFGSNWATTAKLKYGEWTDDGLLAEVAGYEPDEIENIVNSTFVSVSTPDGLMSAVTDMTGLVSEVVANSNLSEATNRLNTLGMSDVATKLSDLGLDPQENTQEYTTALSNLMVGEMAGMLQGTGGSDNLTYILFMYSSALAYGDASGDYSVLDTINANLASDDFSFNVLNGDQETLMEVVENGLWDADGNYLNQDFVKFGAQYEAANAAALTSMMGAVEMIAGGYSDKDSLTNPGLYASASVSEQLNNYINAVKALAGMDETTRSAMENLPEGSIAVFVAEDGSVSVVPNAAWPQN